MSKLRSSEIYWVVNSYIGVEGGYLGDFSYKTHREFYLAFCDLDVNFDDFSGRTTPVSYTHLTLPTILLV